MVIALSNFFFCGWWDYRLLFLIVFSGLVRYVVGITFYTFQTWIYSIDLYKEEIKPTTDFIALSTFASFISQWIAEPIQRESHLLSQFFKKRVLNYSNALFALHREFDKVIVKNMNELGLQTIQLIVCDESWSFTKDSHWNCFGLEQVAKPIDLRFFINLKY